MSFEDRTTLTLQRCQGRVVGSERTGFIGNRIPPVRHGLQDVDQNPCTRSVFGQLIVEIDLGCFANFAISQVLFVRLIEGTDIRGQQVGCLMEPLVEIDPVANNVQFALPQ